MSSGKNGSVVQLLPITNNQLPKPQKSCITIQGKVGIPTNFKDGPIPIQPFPAISVCSFSRKRLPNSIATSRDSHHNRATHYFYPSPLGKFNAGLSSALPGMCKNVSSHCAPIVHCTLSSCKFAPQTDVESMGPVCTTQHVNFQANLKTTGLECFSVSLSRLDLRQAFELLLDVLTPGHGTCNCLLNIGKELQLPFF